MLSVCNLERFRVFVLLVWIGGVRAHSHRKPLCSRPEAHLSVGVCVYTELEALFSARGHSCILLCYNRLTLALSYPGALSLSRVLIPNWFAVREGIVLPFSVLRFLLIHVSMCARHSKSGRSATSDMVLQARALSIWHLASGNQAG